jgi:hypothetical protein
MSFLEVLKQRGEAIDRSAEMLPPKAAVDVLKVNNNIAQPTAVDARGNVAHDPLSLGSRTPSRDNLEELLVESHLDALVREQVEAAGLRYTPPERSFTVSPELKAACDRLVAAAPLLNKAAEMAANREVRLRKQARTHVSSRSGSAAGSASGSVSGTQSGEADEDIAAAQRGGRL